MKEHLEKAQRAPKQGYTSVKANVENLAPLVRRVARDQRTRDALRELVSAGRDVRDQLRNDGGKALVKDRGRRGHLTQDIEGSAKALRAAAAEMSKARARVRRRRGARVVSVVALLAGIGVAVKRAVRPKDSWDTDATAPRDWAPQTPERPSSGPSEPVASVRTPSGS
jgi:hypothetical protein